MNRLTMHEALERVAPGTPLRRAFERIIQQGNGALLVLGNGPEVVALCNGGFVLDGVDFAPARLAELAKMDGAIILDDECQRVLRVNVHLTPSTDIPTRETGARHRTAERVARQADTAVVAISETRRIATLYLGDERQELQLPTEVGARVNQSLQTLERFRRRLDEAVERLTRYEVTDVVVYRNVLEVLQRAEMVRRMGVDIAEEAVALGREGELVNLQLADLTQGIDETTQLVLRDYVRGRGRRPEKALATLQALSTDELSDPERLATNLRLGHPDSSAEPLGYRLLAQVPRLPTNVQEALVQRFNGLHGMVEASVDDFDSVAGVGSTRAGQLRSYFDRLGAASHGWEGS
ncbi:MAG: DNA integrity scanning diadenylate cyclase DisA [Acidimicrobiia bacterium]